MAESELRCVEDNCILRVGGDVIDSLTEAFFDVFIP